MNIFFFKLCKDSKVVFLLLTEEQRPYCWWW